MKKTLRYPNAHAAHFPARRGPLLPALLLAVLLAPLAGCGRDAPPAEEADGHRHDLTLASAADSKAGAIIEPGAKQLYTCGMHPHILSEEPGTCPICGMDLVPVRQTASSEGVVAIDPVTLQNIGVRTTRVNVEALGRTVRTTGRFEMDEQGAYAVSLKVGGWVERLYVDYEGALVREGQPLLELYSPELVSTQEEYLLALRNARRLTDGPASDDARRLLAAARRRLAYWDLTDEQIRRLEETGIPERTLTFYAPASGEMMNKQVVAGQQVRAGQALMDLVDITRIWLIADVYEQDLGWIKTGTPARIELPYQPGATWTGRIDHLYYMLDREARTARARIVLPGGKKNPFKPGMYATVYLEGEQAAPAPVVPEEALVRTGARDVVILALGGGRFLPQEIRTGLHADGKVQVLEGLQDGDLVVTSAQFLIDSEARLKSTVGAMTLGHDHGAMDAGHDAGHDAGAPARETQTSVKTLRIDVRAVDRDGDGKVYLCFDAPHLLQDTGGPIPGCGGVIERISVGTAQSILHDAGYTNVPIDPALSDRDGDGFVYQSPMHLGVIEDAPGTCEICNMKLERRTVEAAREVLRRAGYRVEQ